MITEHRRHYRGTWWRVTVIRRPGYATRRILTTRTVHAGPVLAGFWKRWEN